MESKIFNLCSKFINNQSLSKLKEMDDKSTCSFPKMTIPVTFCDNKGKNFMNELIEDGDMADKTYRVTSSELKSFVERFETLDHQKKEIQELQRDIMSEASTRGYDTRILRKIIAIRKKDPQVVSEEDAVLELYKEALGM